MEIKPDDRDEREMRLAWMTNEFQDARRRRLAKATTVVKPAPETDATAPPAPGGDEAEDRALRR